MNKKNTINLLFAEFGQRVGKGCPAEPKYTLSMQTV